MTNANCSMEINNARSESLMDRFMFIMFAVALSVYPYVFAINIFRPATGALGKNVYVMLITVVIFLGFASLFSQISKRCGKYMLPIIIAPMLALFFIRTMVVDGAIEYLVNSKTPILFVCFWGVAVCYASDQRKRDVICKIIIINCVIQALIGIIHFYLFPEILTYGIPETSDDLYRIEQNMGTMGALREPGLLLNPTVYANFILVGLFVLVHKFKAKRGVSLFLNYVAAFIMLWGILLSRSRYPIGISAILMLYFLYRNLSIRTFFITIIICVSLAGVLSPHIMRAADKFAGGVDELRSDKNRTGFGIVANSVSNILIGERADIVADTKGVSGEPFSDNSYINLMLSFGMPFAVFWISMVIILFSHTVGLRQNALIMLYFFGCLWFTNAILWDIWVLYFLVALYSSQPVNSYHAMPALRARIIHEATI